MGTQMLFQERVRFSTPHPANLLWLENHGGAPVIRAMRDNFSSREKLFFLRYLSAEGYLPDRYEGILWSESDSDSAVSWIVDRSYNDSHQAEQRKRLRQVLRLTICSALAWLALVGLAILHSPR